MCEFLFEYSYKRSSSSTCLWVGRRLKESDRGLGLSMKFVSLSLADRFLYEVQKVSL